MDRLIPCAMTELAREIVQHTIQQLPLEAYDTQAQGPVLNQSNLYYGQRIA